MIITRKKKKKNQKRQKRQNNNELESQLSFTNSQHSAQRHGHPQEKQLHHQHILNLHKQQQQQQQQQSVANPIDKEKKCITKYV